MSTDITNLRRVLLWTIPRSISTAFERCVAGLDNVAIIHEPYTTAYYFGPDRQYLQTPFLPVEYGYSYQNIKDQLEGDHKDKQLVFCKDHAYSLDKRYDKIPSGFTHTILIRDPAKSMSSFYDVCTMPVCLNYGLLRHVLPEGYAFKELYELYEYIKNNLGQEPAIIDADDLIQYPEQIVRRYCDAIGVEFTNAMLDWDPSTSVTTTWSSTMKLLKQVGVYEKALSSNGFTPRKPKVMDLSSLPEDVQIAVKICQPYYDKLYEKRIVPENRETEV
ncbi:uncharacterized protein [Amphiura filiformis]|uniref:uncharacterized protein n=1 Tax=Amphiura filiformis TaxID=82378 RepID=UPI003B215BBA